MQSTEFRVGDVLEINQQYLDLPIGTVGIIYKIDDNGTPWMKPIGPHEYRVAGYAMGPYTFKAIKLTRVEGIGDESQE